MSASALGDEDAHAKLTADKLQALAGLGPERAARPKHLDDASP
ncbi:hypothetical protein ACIP96_35345 [Streptomyces nigra]